MSTGVCFSASRWLLLVCAAAVVTMGGSGATSLADVGVADAIVSLTGPTSGNVGDVLTFTMTVTNQGTGTGTAAYVFFPINTNQYDFVGTSSGCLLTTPTAGETQAFCDIGDLAPGATFTGTVSLRVRWTSTNDSVTATVWSGNETNTTNNNAVLVMWPYTPPPPPLNPRTAPRPALGTSTLPDGQVGQPYKAQIAMTGGNPPLSIGFNGSAPDLHGLSLATDGWMTGTPTEAGTFIFSVLIQDAFWKMPNPGPGAIGTVTLTVLPAPPPPPPPIHVTVYKLAFSSTVHAGQHASLVVAVTPRARCTISVRYKDRNADAEGLIAKIGRRVSWRWLVTAKTPPGRWPVSVACGNGKLSTRLHVLRPKP